MSLNYFSKQLLVMRIFGLSLKEDETRTYWIYSKLLLGVTIVLPLCLCLREIFVQGVEEYLTYIGYQFGYTLVFLKTCVLYVNRGKLKNIFEKLQREPFTSNVLRYGERNMIKPCVRITNLQSWVYYATVIGAVGVKVISTVVKRVQSNNYNDWIFSYGKLTILDVTSSPSYEITVFFQTFATFICGVYLAMTDILITALLVHITFQFRLLQNSLKRLVRDLQADQECKDITLWTPTVPWSLLHTAQVRFIKHHLALLDVTKEVDDIFYILVLLIYLSSVALLCFNMYQLVMAKHLTLVLNALGETIVLLGQIGIVSFWGEQVMIESRKVATAAYETDFIGTDLRFQKGLYLITIRSQREIKLSAGKFKTIGLMTFTWVVKTSYSAFMLLRSTQK